MPLMLFVLFVLLVLFVLALLVNLLAPLTRPWREEVAAFDEAMREARTRQRAAPLADPLIARTNRGTTARPTTTVGK